MAVTQQLARVTAAYVAACRRAAGTAPDGDHGWDPPSRRTTEPGTGRREATMSGTYDELPGFEHVLLEDSYVLDIEARPGVLTLRLDLLLLPGHPEHRPPRPGERACFRTATLVFRDVRDLHWTGQGRPPSRDPDGTPDHGCVDALTRTDADAYRLEGDWGAITVASTPPALLIHPDLA